MEATRAPRQTISLELCLDFADTVDWRTSNHAEDKLTSYIDLLAWSQEKGILSQGEGQSLGLLAEDNKPLARSAMTDAYELREAIYRVFSAIAHRRKADPKDIKVLNEHLARSLGKLEVRAGGTGYNWAWKDTGSADMMLWPIARSAAELLTSDDLRRVRECANEEEGCGSLFLDCSKNQTRRWCSMKSCGNRAKFRTYYRTHAGEKKANAK
jgi:predicted RNA-binding Zn ribbon-like protein